MFVEIHMLQNFAPSNLNRDDTNSPKECEFGGYRRARISSQCLKRSIRQHFEKEGLLPPDDLGVRTKRIVAELAGRLAKQGKDATVALSVATAALAAVEVKLDEEGQTQYLLFAGEREIARLVDICLRHWDALAEIAPAVPDSQEGSKPTRSSRDAKKIAKAAVPKEVQSAVRDALDGGKAADVALFGRMLADLPDRNIDAACQVAHALSTNKVSIEFDFFSAVDDLQGREQTGAGMLGTVEFNSACFYRYANIDLDQLTTNLGKDEALSRQAVRAFLISSIAAIPTGKQNSMAAHNPPSFVMGVVRTTGLWSLANAFIKPIRPDRESEDRAELGQDLMQNSILALESHWTKLSRMYGRQQLRGTWYASLEDGTSEGFAESRLEGVEELVDQVLAVAYPAQAGAAQ